MAFIYYADDEQEIRDVVSSFLISEGHEVTTLKTATFSLRRFRKKNAILLSLIL